MSGAAAVNVYDTPDPFAALRTMLWAFAFVQALAFAAAGVALARRRGRDPLKSAVLGFLLSGVGLLIVWALPEDRDAIERAEIDARQAKRCPDCAELVRYRANVCRWCAHRFEATTEPRSARTRS